MKFLSMVPRYLLGLSMVFFGSNKFYDFMGVNGESGVEGHDAFVDALVGTGFMMPLVGAVMVLAGLMLVFNKYVPFALVMLFPITLTLVIMHIALSPTTIVPSLVVFVFNIYLMHKNKAALKPLFS